MLVYKTGCLKLKSALNFLYILPIVKKKMIQATGKLSKDMNTEKYAYRKAINPFDCPNKNSIKLNPDKPKPQNKINMRNAK